MMRTNFKGFTLIELLIVVAIIAILAAIAIPNFLAAQTRSKVSRVRGELKTMTTAIEAYNVDNTAYPMTTPWPGDPSDPTGILPKQLSTPVAYISKARPVDVFSQFGTKDDEKVYSYHNLVWSNYSQPYRNAYGDWRMCSIGPDMRYWNNPTNVASVLSYVEYDPTNGTISFGNLWRSQKHSDPYEWRP
jgi:type II secretion system protein G